MSERQKYGSVVQWLCGVALLIIVGTGVAHAQNPLRANFSGMSIYDNNILNYSQYDIQRFIEDTEVHRSVVDTYDDLVFRGDGELEYLVASRSAHPMRIRVGIRGYTYMRNPIKNYQLYRANFRIHTYRRNYVSLGYRMIPDYYLRHYIDRDQELALGDDAYLPCEFQLQLAQGRYTHYWTSRFFTALELERNWLWYNPEFTEYDTETIGGGIEAFYFFTSAIKVGVHYMYTDGNNVGQVPQRRSGISDLSYQQHELTWKLRTDVSNVIGWRDLGVNVDFYTRYREYTSDAPPIEDVFHAGRTNWRHRFEVSGTLDLVPYLDLVARYEYEDRIVNSEHPIVIRLKEYSTTVISAGLEYALRW